MKEVGCRCEDAGCDMRGSAADWTGVGGSRTLDFAGKGRSDNCRQKGVAEGRRAKKKLAVDLDSRKSRCWGVGLRRRCESKVFRQESRSPTTLLPSDARQSPFTQSSRSPESGPSALRPLRLSHERSRLDSAFLSRVKT